MADLLAPIDPGRLSDADLELKLAGFAAHAIHHVPAYHFQMVQAGSGEELGSINLRYAFTRYIELFAGHVGYAVHPTNRGHRYATRSLRLLMPLAARLRLDPLWVTCDPENLESRRCLELAGAQFMEIVKVPEDCEIHRAGHPWKCRYCLYLTVHPAGE